MSDYTIRPMTLADTPQAAALWSLVFGDDEALVREFFRIFAHTPHFGVCAELDGTIAAAAYCPQGTDYVTADGTVRKGAYLYAVATHPDHRKQGLAAKLCQLLKEQVFAAGCTYLFTKPSEEGLYPWYEEKIGAVPTMGMQSVSFERREGDFLSVSPLSPADYMAQRARFCQVSPMCATTQTGHNGLICCTKPTAGIFVPWEIASRTTSATAAPCKSMSCCPTPPWQKLSRSPKH